jgi:CrcB protein
VTPGLLLLLSVAGGAGAVLRFVVDGAVRDLVGARWPWGTAAINVSGSFLLGLLTGLVTRGTPHELLLVLGTGLLGGYTTFSTASLETVRLAEERRYLAAASNAFGMLVAATGAAALGLLVAGAFAS